MTSKIGQLTSTHVSGNLPAYLASSYNTSWIIDSGATDHMSNKFSPMHEVSITNGATILVSRNGKINFSPQSFTSNVLVVPSFLLEKLLILWTLMLSFLHHPYIWGQKTRMIGEEINSHGRYLLNTTNKAYHIKKVKKVMS